MKNLKNIFRKFSLLPALFVVMLTESVPASAQLKFSEIEQNLKNVPDSVAKMISPIIDIVLLILGLAVIASLVVAYINKRKDNNNNSNDKIIDALWTALVVILGIYAVKFFFFPAAN